MQVTVEEVYRKWDDCPRHRRVQDEADYFCLERLHLHPLDVRRCYRRNLDPGWVCGEWQGIDHDGVDGRGFRQVVQVRLRRRGVHGLRFQPGEREVRGNWRVRGQGVVLVEAFDGAVYRHVTKHVDGADQRAGRIRDALKKRGE